MLYKFCKLCPPESPQSRAYQSQSLQSSNPRQQADFYLQRRELDRDFAGGLFPVCSDSDGLIRLNESGLSLFWSEEIRRRQDNKVESESVASC